MSEATGARHRGWTMVSYHGFLWASRDSDHRRHMLCRDNIEMRRAMASFREYVDGVEDAAREGGGDAEA